MRSLRVVALLAWVVAIEAGTVQASVIDAYRCEDCASAAQMQGAAIREAATHNQIGSLYIYSLSNQIIRKYWMERWCEGGLPLGESSHREGDDDDGAIQGPPCDEWEYMAVQTTVEPEVAAFFDDMVTAYQAYGNSLIGNETIHYSEVAALLSGKPGIHSLGSGDGHPNAYDFINNSATRGAILSSYNTILSQRANPFTIMRLMDGFGVTLGPTTVDFNAQNAVQLRTLFVFSDGSEVSIKMEDNIAAYAPGTALDAEDVPIPDPSYDSITGLSPSGNFLTGNHTPSSVNAWCQSLLNHTGISCGDSGGGTTIACVRVGGGAFLCEIMPF